MGLEGFQYLTVRIGQNLWPGSSAGHHAPALPATSRGTITSIWSSEQKGGITRFQKAELLIGRSLMPYSARQGMNRLRCFLREYLWHLDLFGLRSRRVVLRDSRRQNF